jgi:hypothetical protein
MGTVLQVWSGVGGKTDHPLWGSFNNNDQNDIQPFQEGPQQPSGFLRLDSLYCDTEETVDPRAESGGRAPQSLVP